MPRPDLFVAFCTEGVDCPGKQGFHIRDMRPVAGITAAILNRRMNISECKLLVVMTVKAEFRGLCLQQFAGFGLMGCVTARTQASCNRGMHDFMFAEEILVMTVKAKGWRLGLQKLSVCRGVRVMTGVAITVPGRHMASLFSDELILVVTGEAEGRCISDQQLRDIAAVRVMTAGALTCSHGRV